MTWTAKGWVLSSDGRQCSRSVNTQSWQKMLKLVTSETIDSLLRGPLSCLVGNVFSFPGFLPPCNWLVPTSIRWKFFQISELNNKELFPWGCCLLPDVYFHLLTEIQHVCNFWRVSAAVKKWKSCGIFSLLRNFVSFW